MNTLEHVMLSCIFGAQVYIVASLWRIRRKLKIDPPGQLF